MRKLSSGLGRQLTHGNFTGNALFDKEGRELQKIIALHSAAGCLRMQRVVVANGLAGMVRIETSSRHVDG